MRGMYEYEVYSHSTADGFQFVFTSQGRLYRAPINSFGLWQLIPKPKYEQNREATHIPGITHGRHTATIPAPREDV